MPLVKVKTRSFALVLFKVVEVDTLAGLPIEPEEKEDVEVAVNVNEIILAIFPFGKAELGAAVASILAIFAFDNPVVSNSKTRSVPAIA